MTDAVVLAVPFHVFVTQSFTYFHNKPYIMNASHESNKTVALFFSSLRLSRWFKVAQTESGKSDDISVSA